MTITYKLGRNESGNLQQLACPKDSPALVRALVFHPGNDCLDFKKPNNDGSTYGSYWSLNNIGVFRELRSRERLMELGTDDIGKLACRMYELLYGRQEQTYTAVPHFNPKNRHLRQILNELMTLDALEKKLVDEGAILLPAYAGKKG